MNQKDELTQMKKAAVNATVDRTILTVFNKAMEGHSLPEALGWLRMDPKLNNARDDFGLTPFLRAVVDKPAEWIRALLPTADWQARDAFGNGVLTHVARSSHPKESFTLVMDALQGQEETLRELSRANERGRTPLIQAAAAGHLDAVRGFLPWSDARQRDDNGWDALSWATCRGHDDCVTSLIAVSDLWASDLEGALPLSLAIDHLKKELVYSNTLNWAQCSSECKKRASIVEALVNAMGSKELHQVMLETEWAISPATLFPQLQAILERGTLSQSLKANANEDFSAQTVQRESDNKRRTMRV